MANLGGSITLEIHMGCIGLASQLSALGDEIANGSKSIKSSKFSEDVVWDARNAMIRNPCNIIDLGLV